jgi:hypothetical protein
MFNGLLFSLEDLPSAFSGRGLKILLYFNIGNPGQGSRYVWNMVRSVCESGRPSQWLVVGVLSGENWGSEAGKVRGTVKAIQVRMTRTWTELTWTQRKKHSLKVFQRNRNRVREREGEGRGRWRGRGKRERERERREEKRREEKRREEKRREERISDCVHLGGGLCLLFITQDAFSALSL